MIKSIEKEKLRDGYCYVLRTKQLEELLLCNGIETHVDLLYYFSQNNWSVFNAHYWLPNKNVPYCRLYVRSYSVQKKDSFKAKSLMQEIVLPEFILWVKCILRLPENSTLFNSGSYFNATYRSGDIIFEKSTIPK